MNKKSQIKMKKTCPHLDQAQKPRPTETQITRASLSWMPPVPQLISVTRQTFLLKSKPVCSAYNLARPPYTRLFTLPHKKIKVVERALGCISIDKAYFPVAFDINCANNRIINDPNNEGIFIKLDWPLV